MGGENAGIEASAAMENPHYAHSAIAQRPVRLLPAGKRLAVWVGVNIEHYPYGVPAISLAPFTAQLVPDPINTGWRDYGARVGFSRICEVLDAVGVRASGIINSEAARRYPEIVEAGNARGWCWVAHGADNTVWQTTMAEDDERAYIAQVSKDLETVTGSRPRGWMGPALTASANTANLLAEAGYDYTLDWPIDDEPVGLEVTDGALYALPYSAELNDLPFFAIFHQSAPEFAGALIDQFDRFLAEGATRPRVMGFGLHPFLSGQPFRALHLERALAHMVKHDEVWFATSDEIVEWWRTGGE